MPSLLKVCITCEKERDAETEFHGNGAVYKDGIKRKRLDCIYCCRERRSRYFHDPEKRNMINTRRRKTYNNDRKQKNRGYALKSLYNLSVKEFDSLRMEQNYCCAICNTHESKGPRQKLYVDHSHITGENRGLLCATCNSAIGLLKEDIQTMQNAILYLKKSKKIG